MALSDHFVKFVSCLCYAIYNNVHLLFQTVNPVKTVMWETPIRIQFYYYTVPAFLNHVRKGSSIRRRPLERDLVTMKTPMMLPQS
ncbi:hypothetical protein GH733_010849 [Mirounga leonina]|nr:hypothetical protein GH733_010849 [Mirounga leonina]